MHEALRFDPLAPGLFRWAACDTTNAVGTRRAKRIVAGIRVFVAFRSAMHDGRFVTDPVTFDPARPADHYIHFGHGLHICFGIHLNRVLLAFFAAQPPCMVAMEAYAGGHHWAREIGKLGHMAAAVSGS